MGSGGIEGEVEGALRVGVVGDIGDVALEVDCTAEKGGVVEQDGTIA